MSFTREDYLSIQNKKEEEKQKLIANTIENIVKKASKDIEKGETCSDVYLTIPTELLSINRELIGKACRILETKYNFIYCNQYGGNIFIKLKAEVDAEREFKVELYLNVQDRIADKETQKEVMYLIYKIVQDGVKKIERFKSINGTECEYDRILVSIIESDFPKLSSEEKKIAAEVACIMLKKKYNSYYFYYHYDGNINFGLKPKEIERN